MKVIGRNLPLIGAVLLLVLVTGGPARAQTLHFGTGHLSGLYYRLGAHLAEAWNRGVPGTQVVAEVSDVSEENIALCRGGVMDLAVVRNDYAAASYRKGGESEVGAKSIRTVLVAYPSAFHMVSRKPIGNLHLQQLKGKRVALGAPESGTDFMANRIIKEAMGIGYGAFDFYRFSFKDTAKALKQKRIDIGAFCVAPPSAFIIDLLENHLMALVGFDDETLEKISERFPYYRRLRLAPDLYPSLKSEVHVPAVWNSVICRADLDEETVYRLVKKAFESRESIEKQFSFAETMTPENLARHAELPLHPGAVRYLREIGIAVPERIR